MFGDFEELEHHMLCCLEMGKIISMYLISVHRVVFGNVCRYLVTQATSNRLVIG
jgi:hypothetical protein